MEIYCLFNNSVNFQIAPFKLGQMLELKSFNQNKKNQDLFQRFKGALYIMYVSMPVHRQTQTTV